MIVYDVWNYFAVNGTDLVLSGPNAPDWYNDGGTWKPIVSYLVGYNTTQHSRDHNLTKEWADFGLNDCKKKGTIDKHRR